MSGLGNAKLSRRTLLPIAAAAVAAPLTAIVVRASASSEGQAGRPGLALVGNGRNTAASADVAVGFLFDRGRYNLLDLPGTGDKSGLLGINEHGEIVGKYLDVGVYHGLLRDRRGRYSNIDVPKAMGTYALRINNSGAVVGTFNTTSPIVTAPGAKGFLMEHGRFTTIAPPKSTFAQAYGINNRHQIVGEYVDAAGNYHGFVWQQGRYKTIDVPGSTSTSLIAINDRGQMVGLYTDTAGQVAHGFLFSAGRYTTYDAPGVPITFLTGINNRGQIVGTAITNPADSTTFHGFLLARGTNGPYTGIQPPNSAASFAGGINDKGQIVGTAANPDAVHTAGPGMPMPMSLTQMGR
jgi:probable HAF family extracellular repeat protein